MGGRSMGRLVSGAGTQGADSPPGTMEHVILDTQHLTTVSGGGCGKQHEMAYTSLMAKAS